MDIKLEIKIYYAEEVSGSYAVFIKKPIFDQKYNSWKEDGYLHTIEKLPNSVNGIVINHPNKEKPKYEEGKYYEARVGIADVFNEYWPFKYLNSRFHTCDTSYADHELSDIRPLKETKKYGLWVARDKDGRLHWYWEKPKKYPGKDIWSKSPFSGSLPKSCFIDVTWEDGAVEI